MKIQKGDTVKICSGKDTGKTGVVESVRSDHSRVVVSGCNMVKRHRKPRKQGEKGQILEIASPLHISNVSLVCPSCKKIVRVGYQLREKKKQRFCRKCNALL